MLEEQTTYHLSLEVIIETMRGLREQVVLRASVPALPGTLAQEAIAQIVVDTNGLQRCMITDPASGHTLFEQGDAFSVLRRCGTLGWAFQRQSSEPASIPERGNAGLPNGSPIPRRQVELTPGQLLTLSPAQKKVFALVNGTYPLEYIAHLLAKAPQEIYSILLELKQQSLISM